MTVALPQKKVEGLQEGIVEVLRRKSCMRCELLSVVGKLAHAGRCSSLGRAFTRRVLDATGTVTSLHHRVRLTAAVRDDLQ